MLKKAKTFSSFSVDDVSKAKEFYSHTLDLDVKDQMGGLEITMAAGPGLFIYPKPNHVPATFTVLNFIVEDIERVVDGLAQKGVQFEQYTDPMIKTDEKGISRGDGRAMAWFKDPAGNILSLLQNS